MTRFGIDLGHGIGPDRGAVGNIAEEKIINEVGNKVIDKLRSLGHSVVELRPLSVSSVSNSLYKRYAKANNNNCDVCVSIHANAGGGVGTEVFTFGGKDVAGASRVLNNICNLGFRKRGLKDGSSLAMVRRPNMTAMLIEICFVDSDDASKYNSIGAEKIANAIVSGLLGENIKATKYNVGWTLDDIGWFYSNDGENYYKSGWKKIGDHYYYFNDEGYALRDKWKKDGDKWYYLDEKCQMVQARMPEIVVWKWINDHCYAFGTDGAMYADTITYDGYYVDAEGHWDGKEKK